MYNPKSHEEFEARLTAKYGSMFRPRLGGFDIGPGWYHIVEELCNNIAWHLSYLTEDARPDFKVVQVKEKFASLRFYVENTDETIRNMIDRAETQADRSCEVCGDPGVRRNSGWLRVLCDEHTERPEDEDSDCE